MTNAAGKVFPVHNSKFEFGTSELESTDERMMIPADLENFAPSIDGTMGEWFAMDTTRQTRAAMTGKKLSFSSKGKRSVDDPGNDYIVGLAWKFGQGIMTKFKWTMVSGTTLICDVVANVTTPGGGNTTNISGLEFEVASYSRPTFTPATPAV